MRTCVADLEADGLLDTATQVWCGVFKDIRTGEVTKFGPDEITGMLSFMDTIDILVMHNGVGYDWPLLKKLYGYEYKGKKVDTLLMSRLQVPERSRMPGCKGGPHSVEAWGMRLGRSKPDHDDWSRFSVEMMHRCTEDVEVQHLILNALLEEGRGYDWKQAHILTRELFEVLQLQEEYGWLFDKEYALKTISLLTHQIDRIDRLLTPALPLRMIIKESKTQGVLNYVREPFLKSGAYTKWVQLYVDVNYGGDRVIVGPHSRLSYELVDLDSGSQTKDYLLSMGWKPEKWNYSKKTGERTSPQLSGDDPFDGVSGFTGSLMARRVILRHRRSQMQGWVDRQRPDGRVAQYVTGICTTSRLKHSGIVNVPGGDKLMGAPMRKVFTSRPGYKIVGVDASSCQLRMLAARMGDPEYLDTVANGKKEDGTDVHNVNKIKAGLDTVRQAKIFIYGFLFGAGDAKTGRIVGGSAAQGKALKATFLSGLPKLQELIDNATAEFRSHARMKRGKWGMEYVNGWVTGLDGRPVHITSEHKVLVFLLQSDEAILMQKAVTMLHGWLQDKGWVHGEDYGFCAHAHDEFQAEVREDRVEEYKALAEYSIQKAGEVLGIACPHKGEAEVGNTWLETH